MRATHRQLATPFQVARLLAALINLARKKWDCCLAIPNLPTLLTFQYMNSRVLVETQYRSI